MIVPILQGPLDELIEGLRFVRPGICKEETRYYLCGALLEVDAHDSHLITTDGHRLHFAKIADETFSQSKEPLRMIIRDKHLALILKKFNTKSSLKNQSYIADFNKGILKIGDDEFPAMDKDVFFPDWRRVMPVQPKTAFCIRADRMVEFVNMCCTARVGGGIKFVTSTEKDRLYMSQTVDRSRQLDDGEIYCAQELGRANVQQELEIGFDPQYVRDILKVFEPCSPICLKIDQATGPTRWDAGQDDRFVVVMPRRV